MIKPKPVIFSFNQTIRGIETNFNIMGRYHFLYRNLGVPPESVEQLEKNISDKIALERECAVSPFVYDTKAEAWFMLETETKHHPHFPSSGWESEEKANLALALVKAKGAPISNSQLYLLVEFVYAELKGI